MAKAGRRPTHPLIRKQAKQIVLPVWLWKWLDEHTDTNRSQFIEQLVKSAAKIEQPTVDDDDGRFITHNTNKPKRNSHITTM